MIKRRIRNIKKLKTLDSEYESYMINLIISCKFDQKYEQNYIDQMKKSKIDEK